MKTYNYIEAQFSAKGDWKVFGFEFNRDNGSRERREQRERSDRCGAVTSETRIFCDSSLIRNPRVSVFLPAALTGHFAIAAFPAAIGQKIGFLIF